MSLKHGNSRKCPNGETVCCTISYSPGLYICFYSGIVWLNQKWQDICEREQPFHLHHTSVSLKRRTYICLTLYNPQFHYIIDTPWIFIYLHWNNDFNWAMLQVILFLFIYYSIYSKYQLLTRKNNFAFIRGCAEKFIRIGTQQHWYRKGVYVEK